MEQDDLEAYRSAFATVNELEQDNKEDQVFRHEFGGQDIRGLYDSYNGDGCSQGTISEYNFKLGQYRLHWT